MAINKVEYGGNTLIDLTSDSVTSESLLSGVTAHDKSGNPITGTFDSDKYIEKTGDASNTTVTFTQATNRANISSKEKLSVIMGKIAKFFADLKTVAFTGKYSDLSGTPGVVSKTANGLCPKNGGTTTKFLRDDGTYAEPTASVSGLSTLEQVTAAATAGNVTAPVGAGAVNELNSSLADGNMSFSIGEDGAPYATYKVGADTVTKKLGSDGNGKFAYYALKMLKATMTLTLKYDDIGFKPNYIMYTANINISDNGYVNVPFADGGGYFSNAWNKNGKLYKSSGALTNIVFNENDVTMTFYNNGWTWPSNKAAILIIFSKLEESCMPKSNSNMDLYIPFGRVIHEFDE